MLCFATRSLFPFRLLRRLTLVSALFLIIVENWQGLEAAEGVELRQWSDSTGQFRIRAKLSELKDGKAWLLKEDGTTAIVELSRLSAADQKFLATVATPGPIGETEWLSWRGPNANGTSDETGLLTAFPGGSPKEIWRVSLGTGFSGLTVGGGRLYTLFGDGDHEWVACFDAASGQEIWKVESDADFSQGRSYGPRATPCLDGGNLYSVGASGKILCLNAADGKTKWSLNIYEKYAMRPHEEGLSPSPLIDGARLIITAGTSVFALEKSDGALIWRSLEEKINHSTPCFATLADKRQLLVLTGENLIGLEPESGDEIWQIAQKGVNIASPVTGPDDEVFVAAAYGFGSQLVRVSKGSAEQVYHNKSLATHHATAILHQGHLYGFHDRGGILRCIDFASGERKWETRGPGKGKMIMADGQLIILTESGKLALAPVSPDGYKATAEVQLLEGTSYTAPVLVNGKLYLRSNEEMVCIDLKK